MDDHRSRWRACPRAVAGWGPVAPVVLQQLESCAAGPAPTALQARYRGDVPAPPGPIWRPRSPGVLPGDVRAGYLQMVLSHPLYGRPLVLRLAFGTEVPEISPEDVGDFPVIRLAAEVEAEIADRVEQASALRMQADDEENAAVKLVEDIIALYFSLTWSLLVGRARAGGS